METNHKIILDLPDDVFESIAEFKKRMPARVRGVRQVRDRGI